MHHRLRNSVVHRTLGLLVVSGAVSLSASAQSAPDETFTPDKVFKIWKGTPVAGLKAASTGCEKSTSGALQKEVLAQDTRAARKSDEGKDEIESKIYLQGEGSSSNAKAGLAAATVHAHLLCLAMQEKWDDYSFYRSGRASPFETFGQSGGKSGSPRPLDAVETKMAKTYPGDDGTWDWQVRGVKNADGDSTDVTGQGIVAAVTSKGDFVEISLKPYNYEKLLISCVETKQIDRVVEGRVYYKEKCTKPDYAKRTMTLPAIKVASANATQIKPGRAITFLTHYQSTSSKKVLATRVTRVFDPYHSTKFDSEESNQNCGATYAWWGFAIMPAQLACPQSWDDYALKNDRRIAPKK